MLVRDGATVVGRAIRSLVGVADEVVLVDSGSTDDTVGIARGVCEDSGIAFQCVLLTPESHPGLFLVDEPGTWRRSVPGPFTGLSVLRRFDLARNLGLDLCRGRSVVKVDADDEVMDPAGLLAICKFLDASPLVDMVMCPYEIAGGEGIVVERVQYVRVWKSKSELRFAQAIHEYLFAKDRGEHTWALTTLGLTRDHRDSTGAGQKIPNRNYKVFLAEYERRVEAGERLDPHFLLSTIGEVEAVDPELARRLRSGVDGGS